MSYYIDNKEKILLQRQARNLKNPDQVRSWKLKNEFGITLDQYEQMLEEQTGSCAICLDHQCNFNERLAVDHCHKTGTIRGLLCSNCNTGIGLLLDNPELLIAATAYLGV